MAYKGLLGTCISVFNVLVGLLLTVASLPLLAYGILRIAFSYENTSNDLFNLSLLRPLFTNAWIFELALGLLWILTSVVLLFLALLGLCATLTENRPYAWMVMLLLTLFTLLMMGATHYLSTWLPWQVSEDLYGSLDNYKSGDALATDAWNTLQTETYCCGVEGFHDWEPVMHSFNDSSSTIGLRVPRSCCSWLNQELLIDHCTEKPFLYGQKLQTGCAEQIKRMLWIDTIVAATVTCLLVLQLGVFCCFGQCLAPEKRRGHYYYERIQ